MSDEMDALTNSLIAAARKNGRIEFANKVMEWAVRNVDELPLRLREEIAVMALGAEQ